MTNVGLALARRYVLGEIIGRGGMADVHRAHDLILDRPVAVKLLRDGAEPASDRLRFASEVALLAGLNHRGLVTLLDAGTMPDDRPYLVMELVDGPTLRQVMDRGPVDPGTVADLGGQLAAALAHAHACGVVHRDVKPGNVLLDRAGRVRLADFGIARAIGDSAHHTRTDQAIGTAAYLSPEQVRGEEVCGAADVYSLGLVMLEALTGDRAFPGPAADAAFARLARPPHVPTTLPPQWRRLLIAMTATDPAARPRAAELAEELSRDPALRVAPRETGTTRRSAVRPSAPRHSAAPARRWSSRVAAVPLHLRGAAAALAALALVLAVAGLVPRAGSSASQAQATTVAASPTATPAPSAAARPRRTAGGTPAAADSVVQQTAEEVADQDPAASPGPSSGSNVNGNAPSTRGGKKGKHGGGSKHGGGGKHGGGDKHGGKNKRQVPPLV